MNGQLNSNNTSLSNSLSLNLKSIKNFYADEALHYDADRFGGLNGQLYDQIHYNLLLETLLDKKSTTIGKKTNILDVATGTGRTSTKLVQDGFNVTGLDLTSEMLRHAVKKQKKDKKAQFIQGNALKLPFASHSFDGVVCCRMLQMIPLNFYENFAEEVSRVLKPDGLMIVEVWNEKYRKIRQMGSNRPNSQGEYDTYIKPHQSKKIFGQQNQYVDMAGLGYPFILRALRPLPKKWGMKIYQLISRGWLSKSWGETMMITYRKK